MKADRLSRGWKTELYFRFFPSFSVNRLLETRNKFSFSLLHALELSRANTFSQDSRISRAAPSLACLHGDTLWRGNFKHARLTKVGEGTISRGNESKIGIVKNLVSSREHFSLLRLLRAIKRPGVQTAARGLEAEGGELDSSERE